MLTKKQSKKQHDTEVKINKAELKRNEKEQKKNRAKS